jgi:Aminoglycoside-2''-adenylyltransferase
MPAEHVAALRVLVMRLPLYQINWALTGSTAQALQNVPVQPHDIDVQTDEISVWRAADLLVAHCVTPPRWTESEQMCSLLGKYSIQGVEVELIGALQKRQRDRSWEPPTNPAEHRRLVWLEDFQVPVLTLQYEAAAYADLGRYERAELLRKHAAHLAL